MYTGIITYSCFVPIQDDPHTNLLIEAIKNDSLRQIERER